MKKQSFVTVAGALNDAGVQYILVGGMAVVAHGYGRSTQDIGIVIRLRPEDVHATFSALGSLGYSPRVPVTAEQFSDEAQRRHWITEKA